MSNAPSLRFADVDWKTAHAYRGHPLREGDEGIAKITINRPEVRNAFRPADRARDERRLRTTRATTRAIGVVILTGEGAEAFCSGGDQRVRGDGGYVGDDGVPRLNVLDLQRQIRTLPKPVIAMVAGYAIGGGHVLHVVCDLTIAADNARFGQTGPRVGSFDGGFGAVVPGAHRRPEEGARDLVPVPPVRRAAGARHGPREHGRAARASSRTRRVEWCREMLAAQPAGAALPQERASTPTATGRPGCRSSPATRRCSST